MLDCMEKPLSPPLSPVLERLRGQLVVSVQADEGSPLNHVDHILAISQAVVMGGATALRLRSSENIRALREVTTLPIIGLTKKNHAGSHVYITATTDEVQEVAQAGADIVAFDATKRARPQPVKELIDAIHAAGKVAMADISNFEEAKEAYAQGVDIISTTLSGYTSYSPRQKNPDFALMGALQRAQLPFVGEGRLNTPELAAKAFKTGALCVVVGSAITRPDHITRWFKEAVKG